MTPKRIAKINAAIDRKIADYLASMDAADRTGRCVGKPVDVAAAIEAAQKEQWQVQARVGGTGLEQGVMTEPEVRLIRTQHGHTEADNAQTLGDATSTACGLIARPTSLNCRQDLSRNPENKTCHSCWSPSSQHSASERCRS